MRPAHHYTAGLYVYMENERARFQQRIPIDLMRYDAAAWCIAAVWYGQPNVCAVCYLLSPVDVQVIYDDADSPLPQHLSLLVVIAPIVSAVQSMGSRSVFLWIFVVTVCWCFIMQILLIKVLEWSKPYLPRYYDNSGSAVRLLVVGLYMISIWAYTCQKRGHYVWLSTPS